MIVLAQDHTPKIINTVPPVSRVPSNREAEAAFNRVIEAVKAAKVKIAKSDLEVLRNFMITRSA